MLFCMLTHVHALRISVRNLSAIMEYISDPNEAWSKEQVKQTVKEVQPLPYDSEKPPNHTRFVCISDTHGRTDMLSLPDGDVLLHAGDFSNVGLPHDVEKFVKYLTKQPHPHKVVIAGNHDLTFDSENYDQLWRRFGHREKHDCEKVKGLLKNAPGVTYLEDSSTTINGITIWGSPWQPEFYGWGFNLTRGEACQEKWDLIPDGVDVLMTHGPPLGHGDLCMFGGRAGCVQLLHTIQQRVKPRYHVFGHIHEGYGITTDDRTVYVNASTCNFNYKPNNPPLIFDLPNKIIND